MMRTLNFLLLTLFCTSLSANTRTGTLIDCFKMVDETGRRDHCIFTVADDTYPAGEGWTLKTSWFRPSNTDEALARLEAGDEYTLRANYGDYYLEVPAKGVSVAVEKRFLHDGQLRFFEGSFEAPIRRDCYVMIRPPEGELERELFLGQPSAFFWWNKINLDSWEVGNRIIYVSQIDNGQFGLMNLDQDEIKFCERVGTMHSCQLSGLDTYAKSLVLWMDEWTIFPEYWDQASQWMGPVWVTPLDPSYPGQAALLYNPERNEFVYGWRKALL